ncbi:hypothetical protein GGR42_002413 [Saonia flava]|uniref:histidine kinase n=1 Tax=Saonia flava TaxID=523696 RepID=A0A846QUP6_9FLAO|nr:two-component regulator propeller domain-containing protein [Saonia flava]NJB71951.1 hypothetical protein [Saonia flava]
MPNRLYIKKVWGFLVSGMLCIIGYGQSQPLFTKINQIDGLSNGRVTSIVKENDGFVWIGTKNGLNRYDGFQMKVYNKENSNIGSNDISDILIDSRGQIWVTTLGGGLNLYDPIMDAFKVYKKTEDSENSLPSNQVNLVFEDSQQNLWIGTENGLSFFNAKKETFTSYWHNPRDPSSLSHNSVTSIFEDAKGALWIGTFGGGINRFTKEDISFEKIDSGENYFTDFIYAISYLDDTHLLVGTSGNGLLELNINSITFNDFFEEKLNLKSEVNIVRSINHDSHDDLWIGTDGSGIFHIQGINTPEPTSKHYVHSSQLQSSLSGNAIYEIMEDNDFNIWIGTAWSGINILDRQSNVDFLYSDILGKNPFPVLSIFKNKDYLFFGLDGNGLTIYDNNNQEVDYFNKEDDNKYIEGNYIQCINEANNGWYWLGTFTNGLIKYNPTSKEYIRYKHDPGDYTSISYNDVRYTLNDEKGNLWVATWGGGLNYFNIDTGSFKRYRENTTVANSISSDNVISLYSEDNQIWIATFGGGLDVFDTQKELFSNYSYSETNLNSPSSNNLLSLYKDSRNNLWIGTSGEGINRLNLATNQFDRFEKESAIRYKTITSIIEDNDGKIWFSTKQGIFNYNYATNRFNTFPRLSGDFHINSVFKDEDGQLYFGEANGVVRFDPKKISAKNENPKVALIGFKLFNEEVTPTTTGVLDKNIVSEDQITLKHDLDVITFDFTALLFPFSSNCEYMIKMENFDENWRNIGKEHTSTYTNLSPGDYIFKVKSRVAGSEWSDDYRSMNIRILKPLWLQWWAYLIYGLLILGLFYLFRKYIVAWEQLKNNLRLEKLTHEKDTELYNLKQQFFTNISHEIRTPVTLILGGVNRLIKNGVHLKSMHMSAVDSIKKNSDHLLQLVNELLDYRKLEHKELKLSVSEEDFVKFCEEIYLSFTEVSLQKNINFTFRSSYPQIMLWFDKNQFEKVVYNLLSNAFKFTENSGAITLEIENHENNVQLKINDNGVGMKRNQLDKIFNRFYQIDNEETDNETGFGLGLSISKEIVDLHHGKISVSSKKGIGTQFTIELQKGNSHFKSEELVEENSNDEVIENYFQNDVSADISITDYSGLKNQTILIVEDNLEIRKYMLELLDGKCNVVEAENGEQAYALALADMPDLIISDVMMPIMNGITLTRKLKSDVRTSHIPIILLTARATVMNKMEGYETGADEYVTKPFHEELLLSRINNILKTRRFLRQKFESEGLALPEDLNLNQPDKQFLERIIEIIKEHMDSDNLNAKFISQELGMSHSVLYKKIKFITGMTFIDFVRDYKLKTAKKLIQEYNLTVAEASYNIGYSDKKYFSKLFKQRFGKNPSEFYKRQKKM